MGNTFFCVTTFNLLNSIPNLKTILLFFTNTTGPAQGLPDFFTTPPHISFTMSFDFSFRAKGTHLACCLTVTVSCDNFMLHFLKMPSLSIHRHLGLLVLVLELQLDLGEDLNRRLIEGCCWNTSHDSNLMECGERCRRSRVHQHLNRCTTCLYYSIPHASTTAYHRGSKASFLTFMTPSSRTSLSSFAEKTPYNLPNSAFINSFWNRYRSSSGCS